MNRVSSPPRTTRACCVVPACSREVHGFTGEGLPLCEQDYAHWQRADPDRRCRCGRLPGEPSADCDASTDLRCGCGLAFGACHFETDVPCVRCGALLRPKRVRP